MTVQDLIKDVTTADLTTFARYIPTPADFLLTQTVFAKVSIQDVMWRIKNTGRYVNAAKYRSFDASVPFSDRQAWQTSTQGMLPALGQKLLVGEMELILQEVSRGHCQRQRGSDPEPQLALVGAAAQLAHRHVQRRGVAGGDRRVQRRIDRLSLAEPRRHRAMI